ncbi:hypothetical protein OMR07_25510, partial [Methylobacterium organophilum]|nr:hypothetical protein [Methylobacterium organophilum]
MVGIVGGAQLQRLETEFAVGTEQADGRAGQVHQQDVADEQFGIAGGHQQQVAQTFVALYRDHVDAVLAAQTQGVQCLIGQDRAGQH